MSRKGKSLSGNISKILGKTGTGLPAERKTDCRLKLLGKRMYNKKKKISLYAGKEKINMIGKKWCKVEIYNEYLKKIPKLLTQINTVEKMQLKAQMELEMLQKEPQDESRRQYEERLLSTQQQCAQRLQEMQEELCLIQGLKEQLEQELDFLRSK